MSSPSQLPARFAAACQSGDYAAAAALAKQLRPLSAVEALGLLPLIAEHEPLRFDEAAVRWHARWLSERPGLDLPRSSLALAALGVLRGERRRSGLHVLRDLL